MITISEYYSDDSERTAQVIQTDEHTFMVQFYLVGEKTSHVYYDNLNDAEQRAEDYVI